MGAGAPPAAARYREVGREGPAHAPVFVVDVSIRGRSRRRGRAGSKREAESAAAAAALLNGWAA